MRGRSADVSGELRHSKQEVTSSVTSYCADSIERYFRSMRDIEATTTTTADIIACSTGHNDDDDDDDDDDDNEGDFGTCLKLSFRARVDSMKRSLMQSIDQNDHQLFARLTSDLKGHDLDPIAATATQGHEVVRDSEDFVYEKVDLDGTRTRLPDELKTQLTVDLDLLIDDDDVTRSRDRPALDVNNEWDHRPARDVTESSAFDYLELSVGGDNRLSEELRRELRLNLRDSTDEMPRDDVQSVVPTSSKDDVKTGQRISEQRTPICSEDDVLSEGFGAKLQLDLRHSRDERLQVVSVCIERKTVPTSSKDVVKTEQRITEHADVVEQRKLESDVQQIPLPDNSGSAADPHTFSHQRKSPLHLLRHSAAAESQSSAKDRKSTVPAADVLKPVPSRARPQTAFAPATAARHAANTSKKKSPPWCTRESVPLLKSGSYKRPNRSVSALVVSGGGRHIETASASANQQPASSSADQNGSSKDR